MCSQVVYARHRMVALVQLVLRNLWLRRRGFNCRNCRNEPHISDYSTGFGGKHGVQTDRQDKSAAGWDYHADLAKHESQKGTVVTERAMYVNKSFCFSQFLRYHSFIKSCGHIVWKTRKVDLTIFHTWNDSNLMTRKFCVSYWHINGQGNV